MTAREISQLRAVVRDALDGRLSLVAACRQIIDYRRRRDATRPEWANGPEWDTIAGFESETDGFPIGPERDMWDTNALARLDLELARDLEQSAAAVLAALESIERVSSQTAPDPN